MIELLMTLCLLTQLHCDDISFHVYGLPMNTHAAAGIDREGDYHVFVDPAVLKETDTFQREIIIHELAHLIVYETDPTNTSHDKVYMSVCKQLAEQAGLRPKRTCRPYVETPGHWYPGRFR